MATATFSHNYRIIAYWQKKTQAGTLSCVFHDSTALLSEKNLNSQWHILFHTHKALYWLRMEKKKIYAFEVGHCGLPENIATDPSMIKKNYILKVNHITKKLLRGKPKM